MDNNSFAPTFVLNVDAENVMPSRASAAGKAGGKPAHSRGERGLSAKKGLGLASPTRKQLGQLTSPIRRKPARRRALGDITNRRQAAGSNGIPALSSTLSGLGLGKGAPVKQPLSMQHQQRIQMVLKKSGATPTKKVRTPRLVPNAAGGGLLSPEYIPRSRPSASFESPVLDLGLDDDNAATAFPSRAPATKSGGVYDEPKQLAAQQRPQNRLHKPSVVSKKMMSVSRRVPTNADGNVLSPEYVAPPRPSPMYEAPVLNLEFDDDHIDGEAASFRAFAGGSKTKGAYGETPFIFADSPPPSTEVRPSADVLASLEEPAFPLYAPTTKSGGAYDEPKQVSMQQRPQNRLHKPSAVSKKTVSISRRVPTNADGNVLSPEYIAPPRPSPPYEAPVLHLEFDDDDTDGEAAAFRAHAAGTKAKRVYGQTPFIFADSSPPPVEIYPSIDVLALMEELDGMPKLNLQPSRVHIDHAIADDDDGDALAIL